MPLQGGVFGTWGCEGCGSTRIISAAILIVVILTIREDNMFSDLFTMGLYMGRMGFIV